jgi:pimeloyl-ACP methyl ester carboxylesterase
MQVHCKHYGGTVMAVELAHNGAVEIAYETFGPSGGEPLLLIMGLDFQMVWWPEGFCTALVDRGFRVARFDNRDTGLSTHVTAPARRSSAGRRAGPVPPPYSAVDMVEDGLAVMSALGWGSAHLLGGSMGSSLALTTAILNPDRVRTVTAVEAAPWRTLDTLRYIRFGVFLRFLRMRQPPTEEGAVQTLVEIQRILSSPRHLFDEDWAHRVAETSHRRAPRDPGSTQRQLAAGRADPGLARRLGEVVAPTLVVNGEDDPLVRPSAGAALARRIPGARSVVYPRMGHTLPEHVWGPLADAVAAHAGLEAVPRPGRPSGAQSSPS